MLTWIMVQNMNRKKVKTQIKELKKELRATDQANDARLFKLALVMILLVAAAALMYGRIQL